MSAPTLTVREMLVSATQYWRAAKQDGDMYREALWLSALDNLLDRPDIPRCE